MANPYWDIIFISLFTVPRIYEECTRENMTDLIERERWISVFIAYLRYPKSIERRAKGQRHRMGNE